MASAEECGHADALFIDRERIPIGPPPSCEELRERIARAVGRL